MSKSVNTPEIVLKREDQENTINPIKSKILKELVKKYSGTIVGRLQYEKYPLVERETDYTKHTPLLLRIQFDSNRTKKERYNDWFTAYELVEDVNEENYRGDTSLSVNAYFFHYNECEKLLAKKNIDLMKSYTGSVLFNAIFGPEEIQSDHMIQMYLDNAYLSLSFTRISSFASNIMDSEMMIPTLFLQRDVAGLILYQHQQYEDGKIVYGLRNGLWNILEVRYRYCVHYDVHIINDNYFLHQRIYGKGCNILEMVFRRYLALHQQFLLHVQWKKYWKMISKSKATAMDYKVSNSEIKLFVFTLRYACIIKSILYAHVYRKTVDYLIDKTTLLEFYVLYYCMSEDYNRKYGDFFTVHSHFILGKHISDILVKMGIDLHQQATHIAEATKVWTLLPTDFKTGWCSENDAKYTVNGEEYTIPSLHTKKITKEGIKPSSNYDEKNLVDFSAYGKKRKKRKEKRKHETLMEKMGFKNFSTYFSSHFQMVTKKVSNTKKVSKKVTAKKVTAKKVKKPREPRAKNVFQMKKKVDPQTIPDDGGAVKFKAEQQRQREKQERERLQQEWDTRKSYISIHTRDILKKKKSPKKKSPKKSR